MNKGALIPIQSLMPQIATSRQEPTIAKLVNEDQHEITEVARAAKWLVDSAKDSGLDTDISKAKIVNPSGTGSNPSCNRSESKAVANPVQPDDQLSNENITQAPPNVKGKTLPGGKI